MNFSDTVLRAPQESEEDRLRRENDALRADNTRLQEALEAIGAVVILDNDPADTVLDIVRRTLQGRTPTTTTARPRSEADALRAEKSAAEDRARRAAQVLIECIGANGPQSVVGTAQRAVAVIEQQREELERLRETLNGTPATARPRSEAERREMERDAYEGMPWEGRP